MSQEGYVRKDRTEEQHYPTLLPYSYKNSFYTLRVDMLRSIYEWDGKKFLTCANSFSFMRYFKDEMV